jgi:5-(carboxyamino)imidazole ribonucleotide synthase
LNIGLLGGGQLGLMMIEAAHALKHKVIVLDKDKNCPASKICDHFIVGDYCDYDNLKLLGEISDTFTLETENVPVESLNFLSKYGPTRPSADCVSICQDRIREKIFISSIGVPVVPFYKIENRSDLTKVPDHLFPSILKTAKFGYDGKGQVTIKNKKKLIEAFNELENVPYVLEKKIDLTKELSIILVRDFSGTVVNYPIAENHHKKGILDTSLMPGDVSQEIKDNIYSHALKIIQRMNYCGVLCVEFFLSGEELFVNELAPRPHNSGHQTIEASFCSQFEQQVRVSTSMPVGSTILKCSAITKNLMGDLWFKDSDQENFFEPNWELYKKVWSNCSFIWKNTSKNRKKNGSLDKSF